MLKTFHWLLLKSERTNWGSLGYLIWQQWEPATSGIGPPPPPFLPVQSHSYLELCQGGNWGLVEESCAVHAAWRWASAAHMLYCTLFSWLQCTDSTERKQPPRLSFHTHIRTSESLFLVVMLPFISVYKDTCLACLFLLKSAALVEGAWL